MAMSAVNFVGIDRCSRRALPMLIILRRWAYDLRRFAARCIIREGRHGRAITALLSIASLLGLYIRICVEGKLFQALCRSILEQPLSAGGHIRRFFSLSSSHYVLSFAHDRVPLPPARGQST